MVGLISAIVLSGVVDLAVTLLPDWPSLELNAALKLGIWLLPLLALSRVLGACIRGLQKVSGTHPLVLVATDRPGSQNLEADRGVNGSELMPV